MKFYLIVASVFALTVSHPAAGQIALQKPEATHPEPTSVDAGSPNVPIATDPNLTAVPKDFVLGAFIATVTQNVEDRLAKRQDFYWGVAAGAGTLLIGFFGLSASDRFRE